MLEHKVGCLPVTAADGKHCVMLTASDFAAKPKGVPFSRFRFPVFGKWMPETGVRRFAKPLALGAFPSSCRRVSTIEIDEDAEARDCTGSPSSQVAFRRELSRGTIRFGSLFPAIHRD
jgi:hypothetical protein